MDLGFGIVGVGLIGDFHARAISEMRGGRLVACLDIDAGRAGQFAARHGCRAHSQMEDFLKERDLDVVTICTPSGLHMEPALQIIESGRSVLIEKPMEISLERCDRIIEAGERKGATVAGIFQSRYSEAAKETRRAVDRGRLGRLTMAGAYVKWYRSQDYYDSGGWKGTLRYDGGGALMNQSIHAIDLLQWFAGPVEAVQAFTATLGHERIEVEDTATAALRFRNGALGAIEGSTAAWPGFAKRVDLCGTTGSIVMEEDSLREWRFQDEGPEDADLRDRLSGFDPGAVADPASIDPSGHRAEFEDVADAIRTGRKPTVDGIEARKAVEIILAIYRSAESGAPVELPA